MNLIVSGMVAGTPGQAGASWSVMQWVLGLQELGHDVTLVEEVAAYRIVPAGRRLEDSENARYFLELARDLGVEDSVCLFTTGSMESVGLGFDELERVAGACDCLLNISGTLKDERILAAIGRRVYVDVDPGFTQLWDLQGFDLGLQRHDRFLTLGLGIGTADCPVPAGGREWVPMLPPVVISRWPAAVDPPTLPITTVVNWRGYGSIEHDGVFYGQKVHSFRRFFDLPKLTAEEFVLACTIGSEEKDDLAALAVNGWNLADPSQIAGTAGAYRDFVSGSIAELNVAKSGYVASNCGWFSDRSACYLASGRPVVAQATGLPESLLTGEGFLTFSTIEQAAEAVAEVLNDYPRHCKAARSFAEVFLDSRIVLSRALEAVSA